MGVGPDGFECSQRRHAENKRDTSFDRLKRFAFFRTEEFSSSSGCIKQERAPLMTGPLAALWGEIDSDRLGPIFTPSGRALRV